MQKAMAWIKSEAVLCAAFLAAAVSACFVPPSAAYADYLDYKVLSMLLCLMAVVAGASRLGALEVLSQRLAERVKSRIALVFVLVMLCFFSSMLITNDVALITFVPFTLAVLSLESQREKIFVITLQTVAANLGSMLLPVGNPQNLFLYSKYEFGLPSFLRLTAPIAAVSFVLIAAVILLGKNRVLAVHFPQKAVIRDKRKLCAYAALFLLCLFSVFGLLDYRIALLIVAAFLLAFDRAVFQQVDYSLLFTFVFFFIFVGNISRSGTVSQFLSFALDGREFAAAVLASQVISNVPAAMMLSGFTENGAALVAGTNIGGLGTLVASLASLISFKLYAKSEGAKKKEYLLCFSIFNFAFLAALCLFALLAFRGSL